MDRIVRLFVFSSRSLGRAPRGSLGAANHETLTHALPTPPAEGDPAQYALRGRGSRRRHRHHHGARRQPLPRLVHVRLVLPPPPSLLPSRRRAHSASEPCAQVPRRGHRRRRAPRRPHHGRRPHRALVARRPAAQPARRAVPPGPSSSHGAGARRGRVGQRARRGAPRQDEGARLRLPRHEQRLARRGARHQGALSFLPSLFLCRLSHEPAFSCELRR